jgi:hypothetical protein
MKTPCYCAFCKTEIDKPKGLQLKYCDHFIHKSCLEDVFSSNKNECPTCETKLLKGWENCLNVPKVKVKKMVKKTLDQNLNDALNKQKSIEEQKSFGVQGSGFV